MLVCHMWQAMASDNYPMLAGWFGGPTGANPVRICANIYDNQWTCGGLGSSWSVGQHLNKDYWSFMGCSLGMQGLTAVAWFRAYLTQSIARQSLPICGDCQGINVSRGTRCTGCWPANTRTHMAGSKWFRSGCYMLLQLFGFMAVGCCFFSTESHLRLYNNHQGSVHHQE